MSSESEALISKLPFVKLFVIQAVKISVDARKKISDREIIDTELVPRVSPEVMQASMRQRIIPPTPKAPEPIKKPLVPRMHPQVPPLNAVFRARPQVPPKPLTPPRPMIPPQRMFRPRMQVPRPVPPRVMHQRHVPPRHVHLPRVPTVPHTPFPNPLQPKVNKTTGHVEGYGKINAFLEDPTITTIECPGPGKPIVIVRAGQRQITRIVLGPDEIQDILDTVADEAHIPLLEGVFRAAVDSFAISAVISEMIGSKFVIKKNTPYSVLEK